MIKKLRNLPNKNKKSRMKKAMMIKKKQKINLFRNNKNYLLSIKMENKLNQKHNNNKKLNQEMENSQLPL